MKDDQIANELNITERQVQSIRLALKLKRREPSAELRADHREQVKAVVEDAIKQHWHNPDRI